MTLVGTAPNLVFARSYEVAMRHSVGFLQWMLIAVPLGLGLLAVLLGVVYFRYFRKIPRFAGLRGFLHEERDRLGVWSDAEKTVMAVFVVTAFLWIGRKSIRLGHYIIPGWADLIPYGALLDDASIAVAMATLLFFIPASFSRPAAGAILDETVFAELPWSVVVLFGGGFALAYGFVESGLSAFLAGQLHGLNNFYLAGIIATVASGMSLLTELTSNTATAQLVMPILNETAHAVGVSPVWLMLPAVFAASCAFMFPVATPPNTIVFATGNLKIAEMLKSGFVLNCAAVILITALCYMLIPVVMLG